MLSKGYILFLSCLMLLLGCTSGTALDNLASSPCHDRAMTIIPQPVSMQAEKGEFKLSAKTTVVIDVDTSLESAVSRTASFFADQLKQSSGFSLKTVRSSRFGKKSGTIRFKQISNADSLPDEGYLLEVTPKQVTIQAAQSAGFFYGMQTLLQLLPPEVFSLTVVTDKNVQWTIPCVQIRDYPRFGWRGIMLDASRHFQSLEYVKRYLDLMAMHKLNVFHWHLVDGHGWRIEIKKYPKLTSVSAWRNQPGYSEEHGPYGGFYTQEQVREIVRYAAERNITVLPEIEMPGHSWEVFAAYPELSCTEEKQEVAYFFNYPARAQRFPTLPGSDVFCAGKEESFQFLEDVLLEVMELFPSKYIHVGGDEVDKKWWKQCDRCQSRMKAEKLKNENELQSYFIQRMEKFLNAHGRKLIGWDEILEGGLAEDATVMSWRGTEGGIKAAKMGHDVVMTPQKPLYFDHGQSTDPLHPPHWPGIETIEEVYAYEPIPSELTADQAKHILGAQANMWTIFTHTGALIDLQTFPRACALSETAWSAKEVRNWDSFTKRLDIHYKRLDLLGVNYYKKLSTEVGHWSPEMVSQEKKTMLFDVSDSFNELGLYYVSVDYAKGAHGLDIAEVALLADGEVITRDTHPGFTGWADRDNFYRIEFPRRKAGVRYQLRITASASGGTDSYGTVFLSRLKNNPSGKSI